MTNSKQLKNRFHDAWKITQPDIHHYPTCGIFDYIQWSEKSHCRDFFFITDSLKNTLKDFTVNQISQAADHQPVTINLELLI